VAGSRSSTRGIRYIEVVTDAYEAPPLPKKLHESVKSLYNAQ
jgi:indolepyruvate decarboxylase